MVQVYNIFISVITWGGFLVNAVGNLDCNCETAAENDQSNIGRVWYCTSYAHLWSISGHFTITVIFEAVSCNYKHFEVK